VLVGIAVVDDDRKTSGGGYPEMKAKEAELLIFGLSDLRRSEV